MDISAWIDTQAARKPDKTAIQFDQSALSYGGLAARIAGLAGLLRDQLDVGHGDRVAYLGQNHPDLITLLFACARVGAMVMPMNWRLEAPECQALLHDCAPALLFAGTGYEAKAAQVCAAANIPVMDIAALSDRLEPLAGLTAAEATGTLTDPVLLCYTSGATGRPKGVVLDQKSLEVNALNSTHMHAMTPEDVVLTTLPMFHVGGLNIQTLPILHMGGTLILHPAFDVGATFSALADGHVSLTVLVPTQLNAMIADPAWATVDMGALRMISTGSTMVAHSLIRKVHDRGIPLIQVYGLTETCPIATYLTADLAKVAEGSVGRPALHCKMRIVDEQGNDVAVGQTGEILIRGRNIMRQYWNAPDKTATALRDGWFYTGDLGHVDRDGFLYVDDRKKDMIISGGENIYPAELENILAEYPGISEIAVVGQPDEKWGEIVVAFVVCSNGVELSATDIDAFLEGRLAHYKHPRRLVFLDALPRNAMGKVIKDDLRMFADTTKPEDLPETRS